MLLYSKTRPTYDKADSRRFVKKMAKEAMSHRALKHPFIKALKENQFPNPEVVLKGCLYQYLAYSNDFLRYLTATIAHLEERGHRELLVHNLMEEAGKVDEDDEPVLKDAGIQLDWIQRVPHPALYLRFLDAIGIKEKFRKQNEFCDEALVWRRMFLNICSTGGAAQALGAMGMGTENIVKFIYADLIEAIDEHLDVSAKDRVFFDLHAAVDDEHGEVIDNIAVEFAQYRRNREPLRNGMLMALGARAAFFDGMMHRANSIKKIGENIGKPKHAAQWKGAA